MHIKSVANQGTVALIAKPGGALTGVGRYVDALQDNLAAAGVNITRVAPAVPPLSGVLYSATRRAGLDAQTFLTNYPMWPTYQSADVHHFSSQNLAAQLFLRRPRRRVVVTVHDIIPYMLRNDSLLSTYRTTIERVVDRTAMSGLKRADRLLADSNYTRQCLIEYLGIPASRIEVVYLGIDHRRFRPTRVSDAVYSRYGLRADRCYLIAVGSDDPRKNLRTLVHALAQIRAVLPDVELIKVGRAHFEHERRRLVTLAQQLGVRDAIHFLDDVPDDDLPALYGLSEVCVMPSLYEGFGFPVLEAMACGTPVVCARAASLPELVEDAAVLFDPGHGGAARLSLAVLRLLHNPAERIMLRERGLSRSAMFTWARCASQVRDTYQNLSQTLGVAA